MPNEPYAGIILAPILYDMPYESSYRIRPREIVVLVVVITFIGALVAPTILAAREAARRIKCENNLRILSLGVLNYIDTFQTFPFGTVGNRRFSPPQRFSWYLPVWSFIEANPPVLLVDLNQPWDAEVNRSPKWRLVSWDEPGKPFKDYKLTYRPTLDHCTRISCENCRLLKFVLSASRPPAAVTTILAILRPHSRPGSRVT